MVAPIATIGSGVQDGARGGLSILAQFRLLVRNGTGSSIAKGKLVYLSGYDATSRRLKVTLADADDPVKQAVAVTEHAIPDSTNSWVALEAIVGGQDTSGSTVGDPVYLSATAGAFTLTAPSGADQIVQKVGQVKSVSATTGQIHFSLPGVISKVGSAFLQSNSVTSAKLDVAIVQYAEVSLTNAQILAIRATPIEMVAAPGAGKVLEFISASLFFDYTGAYTESTDDLVFRYTDGSGVQLSEVVDATGFLDATADTAVNAVHKADAVVAKTGCDNKAIVLHNIGNGEYGGGNAANAVRVKIAYRTHAAGW